MGQLRSAAEPPLDYLIDRLRDCDLVLVEGFKRGDFPKLEVWRQAPGRRTWTWVISQRSPTSFSHTPPRQIRPR